MWTELIRGILVGAILLYVPGYPFFRGLRLNRTFALFCIAFVATRCFPSPITD